ncbi:hypothetical protein HYU17_03715 [Candidatus Woesearchaeota archaeon]|nr:hypothetical protein [Candidatus Woesearchaeota archaeon]
MRYKRPDKKNSMSILEASERDMKYTESLQLSEDSGPTIVRNIYECFRMLGDSLLASEGIEAEDHITPVKELMKLKINADRPVNLIDNLRRLRHNINYYGYKPSLDEVKEVKAVAKSLFEPVKNEVLKRIKSGTPLAP